MDLVWIVLLLARWPLAIGQRADIQPRNLAEENHCSRYVNCSQCLQHAGCAWCSSQDFELDGKVLPRCNPRQWLKSQDSEYLDAKCDLVIDSLESGEVTLVQNQPLGENRMGHQIRPQRILLRTSPHTPVSFKVGFRRVAGYPVDLYYIMDLSTSMQDDKEKLENLSASLATALQNITDDFQMGFGSFIDKPMAPFVNEAKLYSKGYQPYLFRHHLKLTRNAMTSLKEQVKEAKTFDNLDLPEGGLEALMQAVVCTKHIGWRNQSHRLIILSTDGPYHLAGDGKLAGVTVPNTENCYIYEDVDHRFLYDHYQHQDYPTIAQISRQIAKNSMNIIFAVTQPVAKTYSDLSARIMGSFVGELMDDSSNIVRLIQEQYSKMRSSVELSHRVESGDLIQVLYSSSCLSGRPPTQTNRCDGLEIGSDVEFNVTIKAIKCKNGRSFKEAIQIYPVGVNEALTVELEVICECPCDKPDSDEAQDEECGKAGKYRCGECECNPSFSGPKCECNNQSPNVNQRECKPINSSINVPECNGRGVCCGTGVCRCKSVPGLRVWGDFCECDDSACPRSPIDGLVCSGPTRGNCECNSAVCKCKPGWEGDSCQCPTSQEECRMQPGDTLCSGRGTCNCGKCDCDRTKQDGFYTGKYCQTSPNLCEELEDCVRCKRFGVGPLSKEDCDMCGFNITLHEEVVEMENERKCPILDEKNCNFFFVYNRENPKSIIRFGEKKECSDPPDVVAITSGVSGAILAIGLLLLLLWKIFTVIHDRLEYAKFQRDRALARWDRADNPIYKRPTTLFVNPAYTNSD